MSAWEEAVEPAMRPTTSKEAGWRNLTTLEQAFELLRRGLHVSNRDVAGEAEEWQEATGQFLRDNAERIVEPGAEVCPFSRCRHPLDEHWAGGCAHKDPDDIKRRCPCPGLGRLEGAKR